MKRYIMIVMLGLCLQQVSAQQNTTPIDIVLVHKDNKNEIATKAQLEKLLGMYNVNKWIFTKTIQIDKDVIPHSHPILTLHTRHLKDDELLLSTFVHEQIHWFIYDKDKERDSAIRELRELFPNIPVGYPMGAEDEQSSYLHILVCCMEYRAVKEVLGELRARQIMEFWATDHYRGIYKLILDDESKIGGVIRKYRLNITQTYPSRN